MYLLIFIISSVNLSGQITIDLAESTLKVTAHEEEPFYYGFSEGDQLVIFTSNDVIVNIGVLVAGIAVHFTNSKYPDLIIGTLVFLLVTKWHCAY
jgi:Co/Zn/Cd efflux system component